VTKDEQQQKRTLIIRLYREMADMTNPECAACPVPLSCCGKEYCDLTARFALKNWGVTLQPTGHPTLPFMGPKGCTVAPHLRPICSVHTCAVNALGGKPGDAAWTEKYFDLRERLNVLECELHTI
jgi:hypothetical protein